MSTPKRKQPGPNIHQDLDLGGASDLKEKTDGRGSDTPEQDLETEVTDSVKRKRVSIEGGGMESERESHEKSSARAA